MIKIRLHKLHYYTFSIIILYTLCSCNNNNLEKNVDNQFENSKRTFDSLNKILTNKYFFQVPISKNCNLKDFSMDSINYISDIFIIIRRKNNLLLLHTFQNETVDYLACNEPYFVKLSPKYLELGDTVLISGYKQYLHPEIKVSGYPFYLTSLKTKKVSF